MKVFIATLDTRHGFTISLFASAGSRDKFLANWCRENWGSQGRTDGYPASLPEDDAEAIQIFQDHSGNFLGEDWPGSQEQEIKP